MVPAFYYSVNVTIESHWFYSFLWDFFFIFAFIVALYSLHRLTKVHEEGSMNKKEQMDSFINELRSEVRNFSTISGVMRMTKFPVLISTIKKVPSTILIVPRKIKGLRLRKKIT